MTRPISMRTSLAFSAVLVLALLGGCAEQRPASSQAPPARWGDCDVDAFAGAGGGEVGALAGSDGEHHPVHLVPPGDGPCAGGLVVRTADGVTGIDVAGLALDPSTARIVELEGASGPPELLLVRGGAHPRGGFQPHLFVLAERGLGEVTAGGRSLLPFVATDGGGTPTTAACGPGGSIHVLAASTSEPPGVVLAWDVRRTTYALEGATAKQTGSEQLVDHAADPVLRNDMPELFAEDGSFFADCLR